MQFVSIIIYAIVSVSGLTLVKLGSENPLTLEIAKNYFSMNAGWVTILGLLLYVVSFLMYMKLVAQNSLTYLMPVSQGVVYLLTLLVSLYVLHEKMAMHQWMGCLLILSGLILMNIKKG